MGAKTHTISIRPFYCYLYIVLSLFLVCGISLRHSVTVVTRSRPGQRWFLRHVFASRSSRSAPSPLRCGYKPEKPSSSLPRHQAHHSGGHSYRHHVRHSAGSSSLPPTKAPPNPAVSHVADPATVLPTALTTPPTKPPTCPQHQHRRPSHQPVHSTDTAAPARHRHQAALVDHNNRHRHRPSRRAAPATTPPRWTQPCLRPRHSTRHRPPEHHHTTAVGKDTVTTTAPATGHTSTRAAPA